MCSPASWTCPRWRRRGRNKVGSKVQTAAQTFRTNEALRAFREAVQRGVCYSIPRQLPGDGPSDTNIEPVAQAMKPSEADARELLRLVDVAEIAGLEDDGFEDDLGTSSTTRPPLQVPAGADAQQRPGAECFFFQLVSAHPSAVGRKDRVDQRSDAKALTARDIAVSEHMALQYDAENMTAEVNMAPVSHAVGSRLEQVLFLRDAALTEVKVWEALGAPCMEWAGTPGPHELEPALAARCLEAFVQSGARHGTSGFVDPSSLSAEMLDAMRCLAGLGLAEEVHAGFQLSSLGSTSVRLYHKIGNPKSLIDLGEGKPFSERSAFALLHVLEESGWTVTEHFREQPFPPACTFDATAVTGRHEVVVSAKRSTLSRAYLACLASINDHGDAGQQFRTDLLAIGMAAIKHLEADSYYKALLNPKGAHAAALLMDDDAGVGSAAGHRRRHVGRGGTFKLEQSQKWGCVSILGKKTHGNPALQCCCPFPGHNIGKASCNFTLAFKTMEERSLVLHRFKAWVVQGVQCKSRFAHQNFKNAIKKAPVEDLPLLVDLEAQRPDEIPADDVADAVPGGKRKRGGGGAAASSKRGRGGRAGLRGGRGSRGGRGGRDDAEPGTAGSSSSGSSDSPSAKSSGASSSSSSSDSSSTSSRD